MSEIAVLILSFSAGILLGAFFFGGLWWTTKHLVSTRRPAFLLTISALLRFGVTLIGFYFISDHNWRRIVACLIGFVMARILLKGWTQASKKQIKGGLRAS